MVEKERNKNENKVKQPVLLKMEEEMRKKADKTWKERIKRK